MKSHPALKMTVTECFEKFYPKEELASSTVIKVRIGLAHWEKRTGRIRLGRITNEVVAKFRAAMIEEGYEPRSIRGFWGDVRMVLRLMGPPSHGNPFALGALSGFIAMRPVRFTHRRPTRIPLDNLSAMYAGCWRARWPRVGVPAPDWWRAMIVMAYTSGLRRGDLFRLRWTQVDLGLGMMDFTARKTGKADVWPLHPVAVKHLRRIANGGEFVFRGVWSKYGGGFYTRWKELREQAGIVEEFGLHDIRRTAASEIERIKPGLAAEFLQHAPRTVTDTSYLNRFDELKEALAHLRVPTIFAELEPDQSVELPAGDAEPIPPVGEEWQFSRGGFRFRGRYFSCASAVRRGILKALVNARDPLGWREVLTAAYGNDRPDLARPVRRAHVQMCDLRDWLRKTLAIPEGINPLPCVSYGDGGAWTIWIPESQGALAGH